MPAAGLEAVLVAVELALESTPRVSVEHVRNVLSRLSEAPKPPNVATTLAVATPPIADPARYDHLREELDHA